MIDPIASSPKNHPSPQDINDNSTLSRKSKSSMSHLNPSMSVAPEK